MSRTTTESANIYKYCKVDLTFAKKSTILFAYIKKK